RPRYDVRHDQGGIRAPGRPVRKCRLQRVPAVRRGDRAKLRHGDRLQFQRGLPLLRPGSSVVINASVGAHKGWPTTSTVSTCKAAVVHLARILSAELVDRGIRVNTLSPGPTDTAMFGRFPGEEQGEAVKDVLRTNNPSKRM